jgi:hypothetical protein
MTPDVRAKYYRCGPHMRGREPTDPPYFDSACGECVRLKSIGKRTGLEAPPAGQKASGSYHRQKDRAMYQEAAAKKRISNARK